MSVNFKTAHEVSEHLLERSGTAMLSGDFDTFASCFELPQEMDTFHGRNLVETRDELRTIYDSVRQLYRSHGVTDMARHCVEAVFVNADTVRATHQARLLSGTELVLGPFWAMSVLRRDGDVWRVASCQYAINDAPDLNDALAGTYSEKQAMRKEGQHAKD